MSKIVYSNDSNSKRGRKKPRKVLIFIGNTRIVAHTTETPCSYLVDNHFFKGEPGPEDLELVEIIKEFNPLSLNPRIHDYKIVNL